MALYLGENLIPNVQSGNLTNSVLYDPQSLTDEQKAQARANIGAVSEAEIDTLTLGIASDGLIYIFKNGEPIGNGIPQGQSGDVFGYVDENNTIVLNGNLADGTYTLKYEMENGQTINVGNLVLDTNVYYSVTKNLTQCTISNSATTVKEGDSYSATITANDGYELKSVAVTMGDSNVSVSGGTISIAEVTGDIVITAVAEEAVAQPTNFAVYNATNTSDWSLWINNARIGSDGEYRSDADTSDGTPAVSNWIEVQNGDIVEFSGIYSVKSSGAYTSGKAVIQVGLLSALTSVFTDISTDNSTFLGSFTVNNSTVGYIRIGGYTTGVYGDPVINIKRNGEYL